MTTSQTAYWKKWRKSQNVKQLLNFNNQNIIILIIKKSKNISIKDAWHKLPILAYYAPFFKSIIRTPYIGTFQKLDHFCQVWHFLPSIPFPSFLCFSLYFYIFIYLYFPLGRVRIIIRINNNKTLISIVIKQSKNK